MKKSTYFSICFSLSFISFMSMAAFADPIKTPAINQYPDEYPTYVSAKNVSPSDQIPMEALWLHLNASRVGGVTLPKSFDVSVYWPYMADHNREYIAYRKSADDGTCNLNTNNNATIERAMQQQGLDIYDGAVWQMALAVALKNNPSALYIQDIEDYKNFLVNGVNGGFQSYYAFKGYTYNGMSMPAAKNAYLLKFVSPTWASNHDSLNNCEMQWPEWSAVTGEEAWAVLIGPVQSIYQLNKGASNPAWSSTTQAGDYIQLGINALDAIKQMQAPTGGVYRNVAFPGQSQNFDISLENNFSLYAGLNMLQKALKDRISINQNKLKTINSKDTQHINSLQKIIQTDEEDIQKIIGIKQGMVKFFAGQGGVTVFNHTGNYFYSSANGSTPGQTFAVDVQTWGATVIATSKKDKTEPNDPDLLQVMTDTYGPDVMYNMFEAAISESAYKDSSNTLLGVGYGSQKPADNFYQLSGEWTLGAINAAIVLADHYKNDPDKYATLISQAHSMMIGVTNEASSLQGPPSGGTSRLSYLYANKRAFIPFGWFSNKMPETASTGWSLMVNSCFNPLELGGGSYQEICQEVMKK